MKIFSFGCSGEEQAHIGAGTFVPYAKGPGTFVPYAKGPGKFISAGAQTDSVGGSLTEGFGQGAGLALGLVAVGSAFAWVRTRSGAAKGR